MGQSKQRSSWSGYTKTPPVVTSSTLGYVVFVLGVPVMIVVLVVRTPDS